MLTASRVDIVEAPPECNPPAGEPPPPWIKDDDIAGEGLAILRAADEALA